MIKIKFIFRLQGRLNPPTKEEYIKFTLDMADKYPELESPEELDRLSLVYGIAEPSLLQFGGLHDFIYRQDLERLEKWAFTVEAHHKQVTGKKLIGGYF